MDDFSYQLDEPSHTLTVTGELDEGATVVLRDVVAKATDDLSSDLRIALDDVTFLPSAAVGVLAVAQSTAGRNGAEITFLASEGTLAQRVLLLCGLTYEDPRSGASEVQPG